MCKGCGKGRWKEVRWLGMYWRGTPYPKRLFRKGPHHGCGCLVIGKDAWYAVEAGWKTYRALCDMRKRARKPMTGE